MSEDEQHKVRQQLRRLIDTPLFRNSRRYPVLLRFLVEETLEGRGDLLKERLIGIHVFDRPADYDTAADPVVRVTVAEIRKRIAQYYNDEEHDAEIRIELLPGRYAPEFRFRNSRRDLETPPQREPDLQTLEDITLADHMPAETDSQVVQALQPVASPRRRHILIAVAAALSLLALAAILTLRWPHQSATDQFWQPILNTSSPILVCLPTGAGRKIGPTDFSLSPPLPDPAAQTFLDHQTLGENVVYSDMLATIKVTNLLAIQRRDFRVKLNMGTNLEDLRQGPAVLIGGLDNQWTMQALSTLRFHFGGLPANQQFWIVDTRNPHKTDWSLDLNRRYLSVTRDYAIVARVHNEETGQPQLIVAGIGMSGTAAAGEFLTNDRDLVELRNRLGANLKNHDFEVVLSTDVINGSAGSPKILETYSW